MAAIDQRDEQHHKRSRRSIRLLYRTALFVLEAANAKATDSYQRRGKWWLHVIGKGGAEGELPVSNALMMADFARCRVFRGLSSVPSGREPGPAVMSIAGDDARHLTPAAIYLIVRKMFRRAADALEPSDPSDAATLRRAWPRWLRRSAASLQADADTDLPFIQKNLRRVSIETTGICLHAEDDRRHAYTAGKQQEPQPRQPLSQ